jgi:hypothetical protein
MTDDRPDLSSERALYRGKKGNFHTTFGQKNKQHGGHKDNTNILTNGH